MQEAKSTRKLKPWITPKIQPLKISETQQLPPDDPGEQQLS